MIFSSDIRACFSLERAVAGREKRNGDYRSTIATSDGSPPRLQLICTFPSLLCFSIAASTCKNCEQMYLPPAFLQFSTENSRNVWLLVNPLCRAKTNVLWLSDGSYRKVRFRFPSMPLLSFEAQPADCPSKRLGSFRATACLIGTRTAQPKWKYPQSATHPCFDGGSGDVFLSIELVAV